MARSTNDAIRISIPAAVAGNIKILKSSLEGIAEKLGCRPCFSGADCFFQLEKNFIINEKGLSSAKAITPVSDVAEKRFAGRPSGKTVRIALSGKAGYSIETILASVEKIAELSGHTACATGCNLFFQHFLDDMRSFTVNEKGLMKF